MLFTATPWSQQPLMITDDIPQDQEVWIDRRRLGLGGLKRLEDLRKRRLEISGAADISQGARCSGIPAAGTRSRRERLKDCRPENGCINSGNDRFRV